MAEQTLFEKTLRSINSIFNTLGLFLEPSKLNRWQIIKYRCLFVFNYIWLNSDMPGAVYWFIDGIQNQNDIRELAQTAPCLMLCGVSNIKTLFLIIYNSLIDNIVHELRELNSAEEQNVEEKKRIEKEERRFLNFVLKSLNVFNIGLVISFSFMPLIIIAIKYMETKELELALPFFVIYPFDAFNMKYWPYVYLKQIWSECIVLLQICAADYFYYFCCTYIRIQFRLLSYEFENLFPKEYYKRSDDHSYIRGKLVKLIKRHQRLISSTNVLEKIYSKSILLNFLSSSIIICLTGFNATIMNDAVSACSFVTFLFMSILQIFYLCLFGDMLMRASINFGDAVYSCLWYKAGRSIAKDLLLVHLRTQRPCKLTAYGFSDANLRSFSKIISTSWSYFALLNTMYSENQV
ncbi:odorant receptor 67c-like [Battus philenor]|uniref:odorant receptor 67c-like n=1 Tax=Battus philenor TaxID=42288 RepID=UPI0035D0F612